MGGFACPICSEKLDRLPAEAQRGTSYGEINVSATPCGHIFHAYCIQKWLSGSMPSNKQCPCCRKDVPKLRCLALFPNTYDDSILDDSFSQQSSGKGSDGSVPVPIPCNHGVEMANLRSEITKLKSSLEEKEQLHTLLTADYDVLLERFRREKMESDMWMIRSKEFESYKDIAEKYGKRTEIAEGQVKNYVNIENMLRGVEVPVNEESVNYPVSAQSIRSLLEMKHLLQREMRNMSKRNDEVSRKYEDIRSEKMKLKTQYDKKTKELKELRQMYETSRSTGRIRSDSPVAGPSSATDDHTPTPKAFRMKRRMQEPIPSGSSTDVTSPGLDSDVDLFPSMVKAKKTKPSSGMAKFEAGLIKKSRPTNTQTAKSNTESQQSSAQSTSSAVSEGSQSQKKKPVDLNATINLSSDNSNTELFEFSDDDDFKIRGNVPGAPLPISSNRMKSLQEKSKTPFLGKGDPKKKTLFRFKK